MYSKDDSLGRTAWRNVRVALCVNRYIQKQMVTALSQIAIGRDLGRETEELCRPVDCPNRERVDEMCEQHRDYHDSWFVRHCDAEGNLIHVCVSMNQHSDLRR